MREKGSGVHIRESGEMRQFCTITIRDFMTSCSWQVCMHASPSKFYNGRPRLPDEPAVFHCKLGRPAIAGLNR